MSDTDGEPERSDALFLALLAHDLKNAFAPVLSGSRLLSGEMTGLGLVEARELAGALRAQSERCYLLLEELLAWARCRMDAGEGSEARPRAEASRRRPWRGRRPSPREPVELEPLVRGALVLYELPAASRGLVLRAEVEPGTVALSDRNMVSVPLRNLVANAVRLSRPGGEVSVRARSEGAFALLEVSDSGPGFPAGAFAEARGPDGAPSPFDSGMGLYLAREFAALAGGSLGAAPRPDGREGALFTLRLPRG